GGTAAYLAHRGEVTALTGDDALHEAPGELLGRALGAGSALDVSVTGVSFAPGDVMILLGHRVRGDVDRRGLIDHVERAGESEHMLVVRFDESDRAIEELGTPAVPVVAYRAPLRVRAALVAAAISAAFVLLTAWAR
ncbi:MAG TPA: hypothetical protein VIL19_02690, partial [Casimicrobiaceae bacterium]